MRTAKAIFFVAIMTLAVPAAAQTFTPARGLGALSVDLDTEAGAFSMVQFNDLCGLNAFRSTLRAPRLGTHRRWAPRITLSLRNGTDTVNLLFSALEWHPPMTVEISRYVGNERAETETLPTVLRPDESMSIEIDWTAQGQVIYRLGGLERTLQMSAPPTELRISNSTGEAQLDPLQLGVTGEFQACPD